VTLAIDPTVAADVGWQLSFAAVAGIFALAAPLRPAIAARIGSGGPRGALADGAAVTIAATLATAPLVAFHFETFSTTTLVANLLAMPAVAPAMWLGMASAAAAQVPGLPLEAPNGLNALLLGYVAQVAAWCGRPSWAEIEVHLGARGLVGSYLALAALVMLAIRHGRQLAWLGAVGVLVGVLALGVQGSGSPPAPISGLRVEVLDVGQGDAILLQPAGAPAVLVDGGPPGEDLARRLEAAGVERLGAAVVTHDQSDHAGGVEEL
jgi:competence protein ComEC